MEFAYDVHGELLLLETSCDVHGKMFPSGHHNYDVHGEVFLLGTSCDVHGKMFLSGHHMTFMAKCFPIWHKDVTGHVLLEFYLFMHAQESHASLKKEKKKGRLFHWRNVCARPFFKGIESVAHILWLGKG